MSGLTMKKMRKLSPSQFPWSRYHAETIPTHIRHSSKATVRWLFEQNIIGYCDGMELEVRPSDIAVGVLIEVGSFETWAHLDDIVFEDYQRGSDD